MSRDVEEQRAVAVVERYGSLSLKTLLFDHHVDENVVDALVQKGRLKLDERPGAATILTLPKDTLAEAHPTLRIPVGATSCRISFGPVYIQWPSVDGKDGWDVWDPRPVFGHGARLFETAVSFARAVERAAEIAARDTRE